MQTALYALPTHIFETRRPSLHRKRHLIVCFVSLLALESMERKAPEALQAPVSVGDPGVVMCAGKSHFAAVDGQSR